MSEEDLRLKVALLNEELQIAKEEKAVQETMNAELLKESAIHSKEKRIMEEARLQIQEAMYLIMSANEKLNSIRQVG